MHALNNALLIHSTMYMLVLGHMRTDVPGNTRIDAQAADGADHSMSHSLS